MHITHVYFGLTHVHWYTHYHLRTVFVYHHDQPAAVKSSTNLKCQSTPQQLSLLILILQCFHLLKVEFKNDFIFAISCKICKASEDIFSKNDTRNNIARWFWILPPHFALICGMGTTTLGWWDHTHGCS